MSLAKDELIKMYTIGYESEDFIKLAKLNEIDFFEALSKNLKEYVDFMNIFFKFIEILPRYSEIKSRMELVDVELSAIKEDEKVLQKELAQWARLKNKGEAQFTAELVKIQERRTISIGVQAELIELLRKVDGVGHLSYDIFVEYLEKNYSVISERYKTFLASIDDRCPQMTYAILFFTKKTNNKEMLRDFISSKKMNKDECDLVLDGADMETTVALLTMMSRADINHHSVFINMVMSGDLGYLKELKKIDSPYLNFLISHINKNGVGR